MPVTHHSNKTSAQDHRPLRCLRALPIVVGQQTTNHAEVVSFPNPS